MSTIAGEATGNENARKGKGTEMTISRKLTSITGAVALAATAMGPMATSASAEGGWHGSGRSEGRDYGHARSDRGDWDRGGRHDDRRDYGRHRHHDNTGKYIALGVGALMLGIIASEASRR